VSYCRNGNGIIAAVLVADCEEDVDDSHDDDDAWEMIVCELRSFSSQFDGRVATIVLEESDAAKANVRAVL